jgi:phosphocarrier protein HPr
MISKKLIVNCPIGLQVEPAGRLCEQAVEFQSKITVEYEGGTANAKSILSILGAVIKHGDQINLVCEGPDEEEAMRVIAEVLERKLAV